MTNYVSSTGNYHLLLVFIRAAMFAISIEMCVIMGRLFAGAAGVG